MKSDTCAEMRLLVQADMDGELGPAEAARVGEHLETCPECAAIPGQMAALSGQLRQGASYFAAPERLRAAVLGQVAAMTQAAPVPPPQPGRRARWPSLWSSLRAKTAVPFGAGFALAACLVLALVLPPGGGTPDEVVAGHIRALQPGHLMDVVSTDQHTVKPWFDGRLDFAPPVKDLKEAGFPLAGARLDYLAGRPVAVLVYQRRQHVIDVYVWPEHGRPDPVAASRSGYNTVRWSLNDMTFWAVSDLGAGELEEFVGRLRTSS